MGPDTVHGTVVQPYVVETAYTVPHGLHGTIYTERFLALPMVCMRRSVRVIEL